MKIYVNGLPQPSFCFGRILPFCLFMSLLQVTQAQLAPSQLPFPSPLEFEALYLNSQNGDEEEEEPILIIEPDPIPRLSVSTLVLRMEIVSR